MSTAASQPARTTYTPQYLPASELQQYLDLSDERLIHRDCNTPPRYYDTNLVIDERLKLVDSMDYCLLDQVNGAFHTRPYFSDIVKVVLLRNGENQWTKDNLLTSWCDVGLSKKGQA